MLTSLCVNRPLDSATLGEVVSLRHLVALELRSLHQTVPASFVIEQLCSMPALTRLHLGRKRDLSASEDWQWGSNFQPLLAMLASTRFSALKEVVVSIPAEVVQHLNIFTGLTSLVVMCSNSTGDLGGMASLTGLKALEFGVTGEPNLYLPRGTTLTRLTALLGLTRLVLFLSKRWPWTRRPMLSLTNVPWDLSVL